MDLQPLIDSINKISEPNWINIITPFVLFTLGIVATLFTGYKLAKNQLEINEKHQFEKEKLNAANNLIIMANYAVDSLLSAKATYYPIESDDPIERIMELFGTGISFNTL